MADDFSERDDAIGDQFRVLDEFRGGFADHCLTSAFEAERVSPAARCFGYVR